MFSAADGSSVLGLGVGAVIGAAGGFGIGTVAGAVVPRWVPVTNLGMDAIGRPASCARYPRGELQLGASKANGRFFRGGHFSLAAPCGSSAILGMEVGRARKPQVDVTRTLAAPLAGYQKTSEERISATFFGGFAEWAVGRLPLRPTVVTSAGLYKVGTWSRESTVAPDATFFSGSSNEESRTVAGVGLGLKASLDVGSHLSAGFAGRLHQVGAGDNRWLESGVTITFRP